MIAKRITNHLSEDCKLTLAKADEVIKRHKEAIELLEKLKISVIKEDIEKRRSEDDS